MHDEMLRQSQDISPEHFICSSCNNHTGGCQCAKGVFIAFEGANLSACRLYDKSGLLKCILLDEQSPTECVCKKGFPVDITCSTGEKKPGGSAFACWYYQAKNRKVLQ